MSIFKNGVNLNLGFQSLFYWITYSYEMDYRFIVIDSIKFQSLFYWITYSYCFCVNWMNLFLATVSILILLDYLFL